MPSSQFFTTQSGIRLHYLRWGHPERPAIILLHGLRAYAQTWGTLAQQLASDFCCYALDQRGRGGSDWAEYSSYHTAVYVQDLADFVQHLGLSKVVLIGHSMGGTNALEYTRCYPQTVQALVIEDIGPGSSASGAGAERIRREMQHTPLSFTHWEAAAAFWQQARPGLSQAALAERLAHSMQESAAGIVWRHDQQGIAQARVSIPPVDLWPAVRALPCPSLFIRGGRSDFLPLATLAALQAQNPQIQTAEVADASHYVHDDQPAEFNQLVLRFLQAFKRR